MSNLDFFFVKFRMFITINRKCKNWCSWERERGHSSHKFVLRDKNMKIYTKHDQEEMKNKQKYGSSNNNYRPIAHTHSAQLLLLHSLHSHPTQIHHLTSTRTSNPLTPTYIHFVWPGFVKKEWGHNSWYSKQSPVDRPVLSALVYSFSLFSAWGDRLALKDELKKLIY